MNSSSSIDLRDASTLGRWPRRQRPARKRLLEGQSERK